ncbi:MAG: PIG-L family deacetylase [Rubricoccaceae bacterium]
MTVLYVFPHPADESVGPAPAIARQVREGHDVSLLTLTKGGATDVRHDLGLSIEEMGAVREHEMQCVAETLGVELAVLDFPDGGLAGLDPREIEKVVERKIRAVQPDVLVSYAVFGHSGHPDHLVTHAIVKRAYCQMGVEMAATAPKRLALFTLIDDTMDGVENHLRGVPHEQIGAVVAFEPEDLETAQQALACYETAPERTEAQDPLALVAGGVGFVLFDETHETPLTSLTKAFTSDRGAEVA